MKDLLKRATLPEVFKVIEAIVEIFGRIRFDCYNSATSYIYLDPNSLTGVKDLARTSSTPGRTQELNVFIVNRTHYFIDLPGYGFAKTNIRNWQKLNKLIYWYLFDSGHDQKVVLIIDANIGPTQDDLGVLKFLEENGKEIVVVANKVDKIKKAKYKDQLRNISDLMVGHKIIPYSSVAKIGIGELSDELLGK